MKLPQVEKHCYHLNKELNQKQQNKIKPHSFSSSDMTALIIIKRGSMRSLKNTTMDSRDVGSNPESDSFL